MKRYSAVTVLAMVARQPSVTRVQASLARVMLTGVGPPLVLSFEIK